MSIVFDENKRVFKLDTEKSSYAFHITDSRNLLHLYYGGYIPETDSKDLNTVLRSVFLKSRFTRWDITSILAEALNTTKNIRKKFSFIAKKNRLPAILCSHLALSRFFFIDL